MELYVNADVRVLIEEANFTVQSRHVRKEGKHANEEYWKLHGYYNGLKPALKAILITRRVLPGSRDAQRVQSLIDTLDTCQAEVLRAGEGFLTAMAAHNLEGNVIGNARDKVWGDK